MALSQNARVALIGVVGAVAAFFVFGGGLGRRGVSDPFEAIPKQSFVAATIDAQELRRSPVWSVLFGGPGKRAEDSPLGPRALGIGGLADACGFDPLARVERLAIAIPEEGDRGEFGLAAKVEVSRDELEKCTTALAKKHGGEAKTHQDGSFVVMENGASGEGPSPPRLAYGSGGMLVVGKGAWLDAMLAAAEHQKPGVRDAVEHAALRKAITDREGWRAPTAIVTAVLPRSLRDRLRREMSAELDSADPGNVTMAGVLGVASLGVAIKAGASGGSVEADLELTCDSADACAVVDKLIQKKRLEWSRDLMLRLAGIGPVIDSLKVERDGAHLRATASSDADALASAIGRILKHRGPSGDARPTLAPHPLPPPNETLQAKDAGQDR